MPMNYKGDSLLDAQRAFARLCLFRLHKPPFYTFIQLGQKRKERNKNIIEGYDLGRRGDLGYAVAHL